MQVCTTMVCDDLEGLARAISDLVGVVDFGFTTDERRGIPSASAAEKERKGQVSDV